MEHQEVVDRLVALKALRDVFDEAYEKARKEYTQGELERSPFPKGDGSQYGEVSGVFSKATDEVVEQVFEVTDLDSLLADTSEDFAEFLSRWIPDHMAQAAEDYFYSVGEVLDGCEVKTVVTPPQPKKFKYMMVKPSKATKATVAKQFAPQFAGLLEG